MQNKTTFFFSLPGVLIERKGVLQLWLDDDFDAF